MALIKCRECGKDVSDSATACPNCGYPLRTTEPAALATTADAPRADTPNVLIEQTSKSVKGDKLLGGIVVFVGGVILIFSLVAGSLIGTLIGGAVTIWGFMVKWGASFKGWTNHG